ncbi:class D beta-lactamase [Anderseniella sp. Alg231-50]|uniref:class D beta-lactamase n=1 Tax=Anderseniella sp. Alg231-50 TaxID=1922226 RepID=UPI00307C9D84
MKTPLFASLSLIVLLAQPVHAKTVCTVVADAASGQAISKAGDCDTRATPASTFKLALALIGFDAGIIKAANAPKLPFKEGYVAWGGDNWRQDTTPKRWMKYSVVWYSQHMTRKLGAAAITGYLEKFDYGNADFSGDKGRNNALERAWIGSSLKISPMEQVRFLSRMLNRKLPVKTDTFQQTSSIVEAVALDGGWLVRGKTGLAYPRRADGSFDRARGTGWFVGWATKGDRQVVFARLIKDEKRHSTGASRRARASLLEDLPDLVGN